MLTATQTKLNQANAELTKLVTTRTNKIIKSLDKVESLELTDKIDE